MSKYFITTFGCQMNKSDSERIARVLEKIGYTKTLQIEGADLIVVNMCSVRQSAVDRVFGLRPKFEKLKSKNHKLKTVLTGCILKKDRKKFAEFFDYILNIKDLPNWPNSFSIIPHDRSELSKNQAIKNSPQSVDYFKIQPKYYSFPIAFVPISTGCNNFCSYCVVPYTRGPEIHRPAKEILDEVKNSIKKEYKEIWLLGQNVNSFPKFVKLLQEITALPGDFKLQFITNHPKDFNDELINEIARNEKIIKHIHLPVQSGDNEILKKMNRKYTVRDYKSLVKKIRKKIPNINLSTDVIVGFPGETKRQFENTAKLFKEIKFNTAYIAKYSPRHGTTAYNLADDVPFSEKKHREKILQALI